MDVKRQFSIALSVKYVKIAIVQSWKLLLVLKYVGNKSVFLFISLLIK
jgi:hypothetical protein